MSLRFRQLVSQLFELRDLLLGAFQFSLKLAAFCNPLTTSVLEYCNPLISLRDLPA
jgi:hypothetical protein